MPIDELLKLISSKMLAIQNRHNELSIYIFGSSVRSNVAFGDIDVLVVHAAGVLPKGIRKDIESLTYIHPVHLTVMSKREESEFDFVLGQNAISVKELAQQSDTPKTHSPSAQGAGGC